MTKLVTLTLTDDDCLNVRMALNATAMHWGELATAARNEGDREGADTCERIRSDYHRLWEAVNVAQEAPAAGDPPQDDRRYEYITCDACGKNWQRIDWGSVAHAYFCEAGTRPPPARVHNGFHPAGYDPETCEACAAPPARDAEAVLRGLERHASGGDRALSCGGDTAPALDSEPRKACVNTLKAHLAQGNRATRRAKRPPRVTDWAHQN